MKTKQWRAVSRNYILEFLETRTFLSVGELDTSFAGTGYVLAQTQNSGDTPLFSTGEGLAELSNGQTLVAGQVSIGRVDGIYIRRYESNGSVDSSFGKGDGFQGSSGYAFIGGSLYPDPAQQNLPAVARLAVDSSGNIIIAESTVGIVRLTSSGDIDATFGTNGFADVPGLADLTVLPNSGLLVSTTSSTVERLLESGAVDNSFGVSGVATVPVVPNSFALDADDYSFPEQLPVAIQQDGAILVAGNNSSQNMAVVRLTESGEIDTTFGVNGMASASFNGFDHSNAIEIYGASTASSLSVLSNGDIVVGGVAFSPGIGFSNGAVPFVAAEFLPNGTMNTAFADSGQLSQIITSGTADNLAGDYVAAVLPQSDGDIVFAGSTLDEGSPSDGYEMSFFLLSITAAGAMNNTFGNSGEVTTQFSASPAFGDGPTDLMYAAENTPDGKVVAIGNAATGTQGPGFVLARYIVAPPPDVAISDASATAGDVMQFDVVLSRPLLAAVTANILFNAGSTPLSDFDSASTTLSIAAGATTATIDVPTYGDTSGANEQFTVELASLSDNAQFANDQSSESAVGTILFAANHVFDSSETSITLSSNSVAAGSNVTITAQVSGTATSPTGVVTFLDNGNPIGTSTLNNSGEAVLQIAQFSSGTHVIMAQYGGDSTYLSSSSSLANLTVNKIVSVTTFAALATTLLAGQSDTFTAIVASAAGAGPVATGSVTIFRNGIAQGTYPLGIDATVSVTSTTFSDTGTSSLYATYSGDGNYAASTSPSIPLSTFSVSSVAPAMVRAVIPATGIAGQKFNARVPVILENTGRSLKGKYAVALYLDGPDAGLDGKQIELKSETFRTLIKAGKAVRLIFPLSSLPKSVAAGTYHLVAEIIDPMGNYNLVTSAQSIAVSSPLVTLTATAGKAIPATIKPGQASELVLSITDTGNVMAIGDLNITVTAPSPNGRGTAIMLTNFVHRTSISPNSAKRFKIRIAIPKSIAAGVLNPIAKIVLDGATASLAGIDVLTVK